MIPSDTLHRYTLARVCRERDEALARLAVVTAERDAALGSAQNARLELAMVRDQATVSDLSHASDDAFRVLVLDRFDAHEAVEG